MLIKNFNSINTHIDVTFQNRSIFLKKFGKNTEKKNLNAVLNPHSKKIRTKNI